MAQALTEALPQGVPVQIDSANIAPDRIVIQFRTPTLAEAEQVHRAWSALNLPFRLDPLQATQGDGVARSTITMTPQARP